MSPSSTSSLSQEMLKSSPGNQDVMSGGSIKLAKLMRNMGNSNGNPPGPLSVSFDDLSLFLFFVSCPSWSSPPVATSSSTRVFIICDDRYASTSLADSIAGSIIFTLLEYSPRA